MELDTNQILNTKLAYYSNLAVSMKNLAKSHDTFNNKYYAVGITFTMV